MAIITLFEILDGPLSISQVENYIWSLYNCVVI